MPDLRHIFLCHAWDDRQSSANELYELLIARGVTVWFSEADIKLGEPFIRAIDKGLARLRVGVVLVTPSLLTRLPAAGRRQGAFSSPAARSARADYSLDDLRCPSQRQPHARVA